MTVATVWTKKGGGETWRQEEYSRNSCKRAASNERLQRRDMTRACVLGEKTHHGRRQGGRTESQEDSGGGGSYGGGCGLPLDTLTLGALRMPGELSEVPATDIWPGQDSKRKCNGGKPPGRPYGKGMEGGGPGTQPGTPDTTPMQGGGGVQKRG